MTSSANPLEHAISVDSVADKAQEVVDEHRCKDLLSETIVLHRYCLNEIKYNQYEKIRSSETVLESGDGDCTDQSVLLASLLLSRGIPVSFVHVDDHMFLEALLQTAPEDINEKKVRELYSITRDTELWVLGVRNDDDNIDATGYWYPVDPEMSRYLGDLQIHAEEELLVKEDDAWEWSQLEFCKAYEPDSITAKA